MQAPAPLQSPSTSPARLILLVLGGATAGSVALGILMAGGLMLADIRSSQLAQHVPAILLAAVLVALVSWPLLAISALLILTFPKECKRLALLATAFTLVVATGLSFAAWKGGENPFTPANLGATAILSALVWVTSLGLGLLRAVGWAVGRALIGAVTGAPAAPPSTPTPQAPRIQP